MNRKLAGFTLIELLITIVILVILITVAAPSFVDTLDRRRAINATHALIEQAHLARSVAIARNQEIRMVVSGSDGAWCVGLTDADEDCDCNVANACQIGVPEPGNTDRFEARVVSATFPGVELDNPSSSTSIRFEPTRGTRSDGDGLVTFGFESTRGVQTAVSINVIGRVSVCSPTTRLMGGIGSCPE